MSAPGGGSTSTAIPVTGLLLIVFPSSLASVWGPAGRTEEAARAGTLRHGGDWPTAVTVGVESVRVEAVPVVFVVVVVAASVQEALVMEAAVAVAAVVFLIVAASIDVFVESWALELVVVLMEVKSVEAAAVGMLTKIK